MADEVRVGMRGAGRGLIHRLPANKLSLAVLVAGVVAMLAGVALIVGPLLGVWDRGQADQSALNSWQNGGANNLRGAAPGTAANAGHIACGSSSPGDYALLTFNEPSADHYAGVAGDGTWDLLKSRSMVHYHGTPDPGQQGNSIIAFHREPDYQDINQLDVGNTITVQDRTCHSFTYTVTGRWDVPPSQVSQLTPTSGYDLTLITCDPWWQDYNRLVWRATLTSAPASPGSGAQAPAPGAPSNPGF